MPKPWEMNWGQPQQSDPSVIPPDPGLVARRQQEQAREEERLRIAQQGGGRDDERLRIERERLAIAQREAELKRADALREAEAKNPLNPQKLQAAETDAMNKLRTVDRIYQNYNRAPLGAVGFGAETLSEVGGTPAADIAADRDSLKAGSALTEVLKMSQETGKNPFTPMSNSDVELIARNRGNLRQNQSPGNFFSNLKQYRDAYTRAYAGAVGNRTLGEEVERKALDFPPEERDRYRALARRFYERKMSQPGALDRRAAAPRGGGGWKIERVGD